MSDEFGAMVIVTVISNMRSATTEAAEHIAEFIRQQNFIQGPGGAKLSAFDMEVVVTPTHNTKGEGGAGER